MEETAEQERYTPQPLASPVLLCTYLTSAHSSKIIVTLCGKVGSDTLTVRYYRYSFYTLICVTIMLVIRDFIIQYPIMSTWPGVAKNSQKEGVRTVNEISTNNYFFLSSFIISLLMRLALSNA